MVTAGIVMAAIVVAAMVAGVRRIAYGALAALVVAGLWPLLVLLGGFAAFMILAVLVGLAGGDGVGDVGLGDASEGAVRGGAKLAAVYYRFLARLRHPVLWGVGAGAVAGTAVVWAILALYVVPRERRTLETLLHVQLALEDEYQRTGAFPRPAADGTLPPALLDDAGKTAAPILDGFGRPILYDLKGVWKLASYMVSSVGFDGHPSDDDLCLSGGTRAGTWLQRASGPVRALFRVVSVERVRPDLRLQIAAIQASRCSALR